MVPSSYLPWVIRAVMPSNSGSSMEATTSASVETAERAEFPRTRSESCSILALSFWRCTSASRSCSVKRRSTSATAFFVEVCASGERLLDLRGELGGGLFRDDALKLLLLQGSSDGGSQRCLELAGHDLSNMLRDCSGKLLIQQSRASLNNSRNNAAGNVGSDDLVESLLDIVGQSARNKALRYRESISLDRTSLTALLMVLVSTGAAAASVFFASFSTGAGDEVTVGVVSLVEGAVSVAEALGRAARALLRLLSLGGAVDCRFLLGSRLSSSGSRLSRLNLLRSSRRDAGDRNETGGLGIDRLKNLVVAAPTQILVLDVHASDSLRVHSIQFEENIVRSLSSDRSVEHVYAAQLTLGSERQLANTAHDSSRLGTRQVRVLFGKHSCTNKQPSQQGESWSR
ncbi:hypothetical protein KCU65_g230, partial [Aureobasidium melanogenum]